MMKPRHNKKRNTAFVFEALSREMTKAIVRKNSKAKDIIVSILREHFSKGSILDQELQCYRELLSNQVVKESLATKVLDRVKAVHASLDNEKLFLEQSTMIKKINNALGSSVFSNFVPNYKSIATIAQIFNDKTPIRQKVLMEEQIIELLSSPERAESADMPPVDSLITRSYAKNFNEKYDHLLPEQRNLLNKYILSFGQNGVEFRATLAEELRRLHSSVSESLSSPEVLGDKEMTENTKSVILQIEQLNVATVTDKELKKILNLQDLVNEYKSDANKD